MSAELEGIDIEELLGDADLNRELKELGWMEESDAPPSTVISQSRSNVGNNLSVRTEENMSKTELQAVNVDTNNFDSEIIDDICESKMDLNENDLNDPELLSMFEALSAGDLPPSNKHSIQQPSRTVNVGTNRSSDSLKVTAPVLQSSVQPVASNVLSNVSVAEAKRRAAQYRREGNTEEALKWFRLSKELAGSPSSLTSTPTIPQKPTSAKSKSISPPPSSPHQIKFHSLEKALVEAANSSLMEAKKLRDAGDTKLAVERMREHQRYQQELTVLRARVAIPHSQPPMFHYETLRKEIVVEHMEVGEENIFFSLKKLENLSSLLADHSSRSVSIKISFGLPLLASGVNGKDCKEELVIESPIGTFISDSCTVAFNYNCVLSGLKRSKLSLQGYLRKRVLFEVVLHRGFFRSNLILAHSTLSYQDFANKCEIGGELPLLAPNKNESGQYPKRAKVLGGNLQVAMKVRMPFLEKEIKISEERKLVIGAWPSLEMTATAATKATPIHINEVGGKISETVLEPRESEDEEKPLLANKTKAEEKFGAHLSEKEKNNSDDVEFYVSNDALEQEITSVEELLQKKNELPEDELVPLQLRLQLLQSKLDMLVYAVQNDQLSMQDYLASLKQRIQQDHYLALYLKTLDTAVSKKLAVKILRRKKIMEAEVQGVEESEP